LIIIKNLTDAQRNLEDLKQNLDSLTINSLNKDQQISNEQLRISKINNMISTNKDISDKLERDDYPSELNRTEYELEKTKDKMDKVFNESERLLNQIKQNNKDIEAGNVNISNILKDKKTLGPYRKETEVNDQLLIEETINFLRNDFPQISKMYINNMFEFVQLKYQESYNYIYAIRPSRFSLYENVFTSQNKTLKIIKKKAKNKLKKLTKK